MTHCLHKSAAAHVSSDLWTRRRQKKCLEITSASFSAVACGWSFNQDVWLSIIQKGCRKTSEKIGPTSQRQRCQMKSVHSVLSVYFALPIPAAPSEACGWSHDVSDVTDTGLHSALHRQRLTGDSLNPSDAEEKPGWLWQWTHHWVQVETGRWVNCQYFQEISY